MFQPQLLLLTAACWSVLIPIQGFTINNETFLRRNLLSTYSRDVRPSRVTRVFMLFHVTSIEYLDIRNEVFSASGWWSMRWKDERLAWSDYPKIPVIQLNENRIWTPVVVVSNSIDNLSAIQESSIPLRVDRSGTVNWSPPGLVKVSCSMDVTYYPFDIQTCSIQVTSFGFTIQEMDIKLYGDGLSFRYFSPNGEWDIMKTYSQRAEYREDGYTYARVTFYFELSRKPLYYGLNIILPVVLCSALGLFVFYLPSESGEKIGYCLTVLLTFMVILTIVAQSLPTTATSVSILEIYVAVVLVAGGLSVVLSIFVLHLFFLPEEKPIGACTLAVTRFIRQLCCIQPCCHGDMTQQQQQQPSQQRVGRTRFNEEDEWKRERQREREQEWRRDSLVNKRSSSDRYHGDQRQQTSASIETFDSYDETSRVTSKVKVMTWQMVARSFDVFLFRVYALFLVSSSVIFITVLALGL